MLDVTFKPLLEGGFSASSFAQLHQRIFPTASWDWEFFTSFLNASYARGILAVSSNNELMGFLLYSQVMEEADIQTFGVCPSWRRFGIGKRLLSQTLQQGQTQGVQRFVLEVQTDNTIAIDLYQKQGFLLVAKRPAYYQTGKKKPKDAFLFSYAPP